MVPATHHVVTYSTSLALIVMFNNDGARFVLRLTHAKNIHMTMGVRFNNHDMKRQVVFNSYMNDRWNRTVETDTFPFELRKPYRLEIQLDGDVFKVSANNVDTYDFPVKSPEKITEVKILFDTTITKLAFEY
ncbi:galectin-3-like [Gigantopelta aegis]|uniref:galectin-3-like n=1 Tax=Gigantopelta aegis TaxID=1735272 RepID=UPI001B88D43C|nr:galectin-3-like [Gigantopelta aegis]